MSSGDDARRRAAGKSAEGRARAQGLDVGWTVFGYLISGMLAYGGIGWLVAHWTGISLIFPLGMLFGLALTITVVIYRYGRS